MSVSFGDVHGDGLTDIGASVGLLDTGGSVASNNILYMGRPDGVFQEDADNRGVATAQDGRSIVLVDIDREWPACVHLLRLGVCVPAAHQEVLVLCVIF